MDKSILKKFIGKSIFVETTGDKNFEGKLTETDDTGILISEKSPNVKEDTRDRFIPLCNIISVN